MHNIMLFAQGNYIFATYVWEDRLGGLRPRWLQLQPVPTSKHANLAAQT